MEFGIFGVGDHVADAITGEKPTESDRFHQMARIAVHAEDAGFDIWAVGEHHNRPFISSSDAAILAFVAAKTSILKLSTATTLITTNDPVRIAEEFATLQHLSNGRIDLMLGRGNTAEVYPWFGQDIRQGIPLAIENYALLRRLWDEEVVTWQGKYRAPLDSFTATPRPLNGNPPQVWHGSIRSPEIAEQAAFYGDGFFVNNLFMGMDYFKQYVDYYRRRYEEYGHGPAATALVGAGAGAYVRKNSQDAFDQYGRYWNANPVTRGQDLAQANAHTGLTAGSPQQIIDKALRFPEYFGPFQRLLFGLDFGGVAEKTLHEEIELFGSEILPVLRSEMPAVSAADAVALSR